MQGLSCVLSFMYCDVAGWLSLDRYDRPVAQTVKSISSFITALTTKVFDIHDIAICHGGKFFRKFSVRATVKPSSRDS